MPENKFEKSAGLILKETRLARNMSLEEVSKQTRIHVNILKSIEEDDTKGLGGVYAKGFVKLYAEYLGLNKDDLARRFQAASLQEGALEGRRVRVPGDERVLKTTPLPLSVFKVFNGLKRINFKLMISIVLVLVLGWGIAQFFKHHKVSRTVVVNKKKVSAPLRSSDVREPVKETLSAGQVPEKIVLVVRAKEKCWLQVKVDGRTMFSSVLAKGLHETWQAADKIELVIGNAGNVELELNGKLLQKIGRPGQTLKNVVITRSGLSLQK